MEEEEKFRAQHQHNEAQREDCIHRSCRFQRADQQEEVQNRFFWSSTVQKKDLHSSASNNMCIQGSQLHDSERSGSTHGPSMLECGTKRQFSFERYSISTCGMHLPSSCVTEQKHIHVRSLTPALTHTCPHLRTIPTPKPDVSEHEGRSPQQNVNVPNAGRNTFNCRKHFASVYLSRPSRTSSHKSIRTLDKICKNFGVQNEDHTLLRSQTRISCFTSLSSRRCEGGPGSQARIRVATLQVRPFGSERCLHLNATEHGRADKHQVSSDNALHTTGNHLSSKSLKGFMWATFAPSSGGGSCPTQLCSKQVHTHLSKRTSKVFWTFDEIQPKLHIVKFTQCFETFHRYKDLTT